MSPVELLRAAAVALRGNSAVHVDVAAPLAELLEDEAERIEDTPYRVDDEWVERNYRAPLAVARGVLGVPDGR
jgi:hypothetical protein